MEYYINEVLKNRYGIEVNKIVRYKAIYKITSTHGKLIAKPYNSNNKIIKQVNLLDELKKKGFKRFPKIIIDKAGLSYFYFNKRYYMLMTYIEGNIAEYSNDKDIELVIEVLSSFHHAGGWIDDRIMMLSNKPIQIRFKNRLDLFKGIYKQLQYKKERDFFENQIVEIGDELIKIAEKTLINLDDIQLQRFRMEALENRMVSHRDIANHNFIIDNNNKPWIIDFDIAGYESQFIDLYQLLNRVMIEKKWNIEEFTRLEGLYYSHREIRLNEKRMLRVLSQFPNDFFREVVGAYYYPNKYKKKNVSEVINRFVENKDLYYYFLRHINKT